MLKSMSAGMRSLIGIGALVGLSAATVLVLDLETDVTPEVEVPVETPINLTSKQKELLREFEKLSEENNPESSGFLKKMKSFWESMKS